ncbi:MAG: M23 family metallopeptidase [Clostridia bacterium]|nr:M23 family metallopeptidase [Clostridia bacterium]
MSKFKKHLNNKVKKIVWNLLKPFIPFILILLFIFGTVTTIVDAIYIQFVQEDDSYLSNEELRLKNMCINEVDKLNTCNNFVDNEPTNLLLDVNNKENNKLIQWSHLYSIMTFHNMANGDKITAKLLNDVGSHFKSTFKYMKDTIKTEQKNVDELGNEIWSIVSEETQYLLAESDTIIGHYKYTYKDFIEENENTRISKKVFVSEELIGEQYEMLNKYLKREFNIRDEDLENQVEIVIQSAIGYSDNTENTSWLFNTKTSIQKGNLDLESNSNSVIANGMFTWPIPGYTSITSEFGYRTHPITGIYKLHTGTDIAAPEGIDFVAMADGVVITACRNTSYGNMVLINHGNGIVTLYAHGSKLLVRTNDVVKQGEPVLKVGSTGYSTGPHAHFEVRINDEYVNPMQYFEGGI